MTTRLVNDTENPPDSTVEALARLNILEVEVESITLQLEVINPGDHTSVESFYIWKKRASSAIAHKNAEILFLRRWLSICPEHPADDEFCTTGRARATLELITHRVKSYARLVRAESVTVYTKDKKPNNIDEAGHRWKFLVELIARVDKFLTEINTIANSGGISASALRNAKQPVSEIAESIRVELNILNSIIKLENSWTSILLRIVKRLQNEGATLTEEDLRVLSLIHIGNNARRIKVS